MQPDDAGALEGWPALERWHSEYLRGKMGSAKVRVAFHKLSAALLHTSLMWYSVAQAPVLLLISKISSPCAVQLQFLSAV